MNLRYFFPINVAVYKYSSYLCIMKSSLRKTHNDVNAYGTGKSIYYRRLSFAGILL